MSRHGGRPVCAACRYCNRNEAIECCNACERFIHRTCKDEIQQKTSWAACCKECNLKNNGQKLYMFPLSTLNRLRCDCHESGVNTPRSEQSLTNGSQSTLISMCEHEADETTVEEDRMVLRRSTKEDDTECNHFRRKSQRVVPEGGAVEPDNTSILLEFLNSVIREEASSSDDDDDRIIEASDEGQYSDEQTDVDNDIEPLFDLGDEVITLNGPSEGSIGIIAGRAFSPQVFCDSVEGYNFLKHIIKPGWSYGVRVEDAEAENGIAILWKHESELLFDTGDDNGTASDEEDLVDMDE